MVNELELQNIFTCKIPLIDVRAPVEFELGSLPNSVNLPILNNREREIIGTTYKQKGKEAAIELGHNLVSGENKELKLSAWKEFYKVNPNAIIYCFRGGLRSKTTKQWLSDAGINIPLIEGGYKNARNFLLKRLDEIVSQKEFIVVTGPTGAGKTKFLKDIVSKCDKKKAIDLEELANHRGSAFGAMYTPQPTQINFENNLAVVLMNLQNHEGPIYIEDESRMIGKVVLPESLFSKIRSSPVVYRNTPMVERVQNILEDYVIEPMNLMGLNLTDMSQGQGQSQAYDNLKLEQARGLFNKFRTAIDRISKKLGGLRTTEILNDISIAEAEYFTNNNLDLNKVWIEKLLIYYYDPLYTKSFKKRNPKVIDF